MPAIPPPVCVMYVQEPPLMLSGAMPSNPEPTLSRRQIVSLLLGESVSAFNWGGQDIMHDGWIVNCHLLTITMSTRSRSSMLSPFDVTFRIKETIIGARRKVAYGK